MIVRGLGGRTQAGGGAAASGRSSPAESSVLHALEQGLEDLAGDLAVIGKQVEEVFSVDLEQPTVLGGHGGHDAGLAVEQRPVAQGLVGTDRVDRHAAAPHLDVAAENGVERTDLSAFLHELFARPRLDLPGDRSQYRASMSVSRSLNSSTFCSRMARSKVVSCSISDQSRESD